MAYRKPQKPRTYLSPSGNSSSGTSSHHQSETDPATDAIPVVSAKDSRNTRTNVSSRDMASAVHDSETSEIPRVSGRRPTAAATKITDRAAASSSSKKSEKAGPKTAPAKSNQPHKPASKQHRRAQTRAQLSGAVKAPRISGHSKEIADANAAKKHEAVGEPVPAKTFSGKLVVWAVVGIALLAFLFPTVGTFVKQRAEISALEESIATKTAEQEELKQEIARWSDPEYIKQQARDRINLVMPGERKYMVIGATGEDTSVPENQSPNEVRTDLPWADALWDTVKRAATD
ncbi:cell division protein FtsB [Neomicrococcus aestuarii]|uniref:Cell division protein FtsB n=1 Tax=Neomicrococcus aestuarii TaxID=556325 RepID=A0A7W8TSQ5_9MICC|nr:septum formation initiator family protein [Neomicrococcus aestuarii]MBB5512220.1 cell division protein FtsB [Neomicrococcus aestuarii]